VGIAMPSLSERQDDIKVLSEYFLNLGKKSEDFKILTSKAIEKLSTYNWPGNIQELRNIMERTYILAEDKYVDEQHLPRLIAEEVAEVEEEAQNFSEMTLHSLEKLHICRTLDHLDGNKTRAAKVLGITVKTLYNKLHSYGLVNPKAE
jgi:Nif-specific regulatory protein